MKFYDREAEMTELKRLDRLSEEVSQFTVLMGRRRTGKTTLMTRCFEGKPYLYFFIGKTIVFIALFFFADIYIFYNIFIFADYFVYDGKFKKLIEQDFKFF